MLDINSVLKQLALLKKIPPVGKERTTLLCVTYIFKAGETDCNVWGKDTNLLRHRYFLNHVSISIFNQMNI